MKKIALLAVSLSMASAIFAVNEKQESIVNKAPTIIPAIQKWDGLTDTLYFSGNYKIKINNRKELDATSRILESDLKTIKNLDSAGKQFTIELNLKPSAKFENDEAYTINIQNKKIVITGKTKKGVFWGTRTLMQMLFVGNNKIPCGEIYDFPEYQSRGFMIDAGRKFFTIDYLKDYIKILSYYKMNEFQIHLNDNGFPQFFDNDWDKTYAAFRLESETFPGLAAKDGHYTKDEFRELQKMGQMYGVNVIPEIDIPAHSLAFTHYKPEIGSDKYGKDHLDLYNPETYYFCDALLREYITGEDPVFIGPDVHIGTDEYDAKESEKYREFTDRYLKYVETLGKNPRMWGGLRWLKGETKVKADNVVVNAWSYDWVDPFKSLDDGYKLISTCDTWLYIVPAAGYYRDYLDDKWLLENWRPEMINSKETLPDNTPGLLGGMFAVWNDHCMNGISQHDVHLRTLPAVKVLAQKLWRGKNQDYDYESYKNLSLKLPEAVGVNRLAIVSNNDEDLKNIPSFKESEHFDGQKSIATNIKELGYGYNVSFDIKPEKDNRANTVIFKSDDSRLLLNCDDSGCLGFERDNYYIKFAYSPKPDKWVNIRIEGTSRGTNLYVDGKLYEKLEDKRMRSSLNKHKRFDYMNIVQTFVFPLQQIGDKENGFKGEMRNLKIDTGSN
ncbi:MAG: family 20 glycosylhydrolase [Bacteroidales bacterium]|nr:family 20 glycosylhydrolase [Bacteroidales bacterium]